MCHDRKQTITTVKAVTCMREIRGTVRKVATFFIISLLILFAKKRKKYGKKRFRENNSYAITLCLNLFVNY